MIPDDDTGNIKGTNRIPIAFRQAMLMIIIRT